MQTWDEGMSTASAKRTAPVVFDERDLVRRARDVQSNECRASLAVDGDDLGPRPNFARPGNSVVVDQIGDRTSD